MSPIGYIFDPIDTSGVEAIVGRGVAARVWMIWSVEMLGVNAMVPWAKACIPVFSFDVIGENIRIRKRRSANIFEV